MPDHLDIVEAKAAMEGMAVVIRELYVRLIEQGFSDDVAVKLTATYLHGMAGGKTG